MKNSKPLLTVIIPAKNRHEFLARALDSIEIQSVPTKVVVIDDSEVPFQPSKIYTFELTWLRWNGPSEIKNRISYARNMGLKSLDTPYVMFLDSDDYLNPECFAKSIHELESKEEAAGCLMFSKKHYEIGFGFQQKMKLRFLNFIKDMILVFAFIFNSKSLFHSSVFLCQISHLVFKTSSIQGIAFREDLRYCEDWFFFLEVLKRGAIKILPVWLITYRYSPVSYSFASQHQLIDSKLEAYSAFYKTIRESFGDSIFVKLFQIYSGKLLVK
jgi:glycosyltransferase involved in cell wall biosynthesis